MKPKYAVTFPTKEQVDASPDWKCWNLLEEPKPSEEAEVIRIVLDEVFNGGEDRDRYTPWWIQFIDGELHVAFVTAIEFKNGDGLWDVVASSCRLTDLLIEELDNRDDGNTPVKQARRVAAVEAAVSQIKAAFQEEFAEGKTNA